MNKLKTTTYKIFFKGQNPGVKILFSSFQKLGVGGDGQPNNFFFSFWSSALVQMWQDFVRQKTQENIHFYYVNKIETKLLSIMSKMFLL